jgi:hypothetical protein
MRYYKLTKNDFADTLKVGRIYPENFREWGLKHCDIGYYVDHSYAQFFEEVPAGEYFVQEGIMPGYFAIKKVEDNPLWEKYIDWLGNTYFINLMGCIDEYYGLDNGVSIHAKLKYFKNNPVELTLEQWDKIINKTMEENDKEIIGWKLKEDCKKNSKAAFYICTGYTNDIGILGNVESSHDIEKLKEAGVLELWFEPVYKEKTLQFGGYDVTFGKVTSGVRITCNNETGTFSQIEAIYNYFKPNSAYFKFGGQEVKSVTYMNGDSWNLDLEHINPIKIKIGCTTGTWEEFTDIYEKAKSML